MSSGPTRAVEDIQLSVMTSSLCMFNYFLHTLCYYYFYFVFWHFTPILCQTMCFAAYILLAINFGLWCCYNVKQSIKDNLQYYLHDDIRKRLFISLLIGILIPSISRHMFSLLFRSAISHDALLYKKSLEY